MNLCTCGHSREEHSFCIGVDVAPCTMLRCTCDNFTPADPQPETQPDNDPKNDIWFVSSTSGLHYRIPGAAGDIAEIRVNGKSYKPQPDQPAGGEGDDSVVLAMAVQIREAQDGPLSFTKTLEGVRTAVEQSTEPLRARIATLEREKSALESALASEIDRHKGTGAILEAREREKTQLESAIARAIDLLPTNSKPAHILVGPMRGAFLSVEQEVERVHERADKAEAHVRELEAALEEIDRQARKEFQHAHDCASLLAERITKITDTTLKRDEH